MKAAQILRDKINRRTLTTGLLVTNHLWPELLEVVRLAGFDYFIIDQEHGTHANELVAEVCALGRMIDFPVLLRPIDCEYATIRQAIDRGPCGFLLPSVDTPEQLDHVREAVYMPPRGKRRPGGPGNRWPSNFQYPTWKAEVEDDFIVLPQIESRVGLENADAIARHELTTAIAVGPYDLSADLGVCYDPTSPIFQQAIQRVRQAGEAAGKNMWHIGPGPTLIAQGFTFLCLGEPVYAMQAALTQLNQTAREAAAKA